MNAASKVAAVPGVRNALLDFQRRVARDGPGAVLDGRDIGTVVCPDAFFKVFVTASLAERARRRFKELRQSGQPVIYAAVLTEMERRDLRDAGREVSPLKPAEDALVIDTDDVDADAAFRLVMAAIEQKLSQTQDRTCKDLG